MPGLPKDLMSQVGKGKITMKQAWAIHKGKGGGGSKKKTSSRTSAPKATSTNSSPKKMTVGKALDLYAITGPAISYAYDYSVGDPNGLTNIMTAYSSLTPDGEMKGYRLIEGYGGAVNRAIEKKVFQLAKVRGPRSKIKTVGDVLDYVTYFGSTAKIVWDYRDDPKRAIKYAYLKQNGINLFYKGKRAYQPQDMFYEKVGPYVAQKWLRKGLRKAGITFGGII